MDCDDQKSNDQLSKENVIKTDQKLFDSVKPQADNSPNRAMTEVNDSSNNNKQFDSKNSNKLSTKKFVKIVRDNMPKIVKKSASEENWDDEDDIRPTENSATKQYAGRGTWNSDEESCRENQANHRQQYAAEPKVNAFGRGKHNRYAGKYNRPAAYNTNDCQADYCRNDMQLNQQKSRTYDLNERKWQPMPDADNYQRQYNATPDEQHTAYAVENDFHSSNAINNRVDRQLDYGRQSRNHEETQQNTQSFQQTINEEESWKPIEQCVRAGENRYDTGEENWDDDDDIVPLEKIGENLGKFKNSNAKVFAFHNSIFITGYVRPQFPFEAKTQLFGASEIDAGLNSHSPLPFRLIAIDIPPTSYRELATKIKIPTGYLDPRLVPYLHSTTADTPTITTTPVKVLDRSIADPRIRAKQMESVQQHSLSTVTSSSLPPPQQPIKRKNPFSIDPTGSLKSSAWYYHLNHADKTVLNDRLAFAACELMQYRQQLSMNNEAIDPNVVLQNPMFYQLYQDYNVSVDEFGQFVRLPGYVPGQETIITSHYDRIKHECHFFEMSYQLHPSSCGAQTALNFNIYNEVQQSPRPVPSPFNPSSANGSINDR